MFLALNANLLESWICYRYKSDFIISKYYLQMRLLIEHFAVIL
jgi:hypothetical protein